MKREIRQQIPINQRDNPKGTLSMSKGGVPVSTGSTSENSDPYEQIYKEMKEQEGRQKRFFWTVLTVGLIALTWLIYELNNSGGFSGLF